MVKPCTKMIPKYSSSNENKPYANVSWASSNEYLLQTKVIRFFSWSVQTNPIQGPLWNLLLFLVSVKSIYAIYIYICAQTRRILNVENPRRAVFSPTSRLGFSQRGARAGSVATYQGTGVGSVPEGMVGKFLKWWGKPPNLHPKCWSFLVGKPHGFVGVYAYEFQMWYCYICWVTFWSVYVYLMKTQYSLPYIFTLPQP